MFSSLVVKKCMCVCVCVCVFAETFVHLSLPFFWLRIAIAIPAAIYSSGPGPESAPRSAFWSNFGHLPRSAPKSAFWVLFGIVLAQKALEKHSLGHSEAAAQNCSKKHSVGHFQARAPEHCCKWRPGSQHCQMFQECCPIVPLADNSRELGATGSPLHLTPETLGSQGEPWPDAVHRQGPESQISLASTSRVMKLQTCWRARNPEIIRRGQKIGKKSKVGPGARGKIGQR